ncbi:hypothetical protein V6N12_005536 [Hibiscus sabdariffa]|uniref:Uncharacterized protein n=1 Tax=Hibiscus sabdariffa TaxID=183260 RepID=A0ABR1ZIF4_9ROSI
MQPCYLSSISRSFSPITQVDENFPSASDFLGLPNPCLKNRPGTLNVTGEGIEMLMLPSHSIPRPALGSGSDLGFGGDGVLPLDKEWWMGNANANASINAAVYGPPLCGTTHLT